MLSLSLSYLENMPYFLKRKHFIIFSLVFLDGQKQSENTKGEKVEAGKFGEYIFGYLYTYLVKNI